MNVSRRGALLGARPLRHLPGAKRGQPQSRSISPLPKGQAANAAKDGPSISEEWLSVSGHGIDRAERFKAKLGIPADLRTCHTGQVGKYILEGHVPALAVKYLLHEKPENVTGLAVPGMPVGSPGMEVPGAQPEEYSVIVLVRPAAGCGRGSKARARSTASMKLRRSREVRARVTWNAVNHPSFRCDLVHPSWAATCAMSSVKLFCTGSRGRTKLDTIAGA